MSDCKIVIPSNTSRRHLENPLIAEYDNWLTHDEIKAILKLRKQLDWYPGNSADHVTLTSSYRPEIRLAENHKVGVNDRSCLTSLGKKVAKFFSLPSEKYIEPTLLVRYSVGGHFVNHTDRWQEINSLGITTDRQATFMVYLNADYEGGRTYFQNANITIEPTPGKALLFTYGDDFKRKHHPNSYHAGLPVTAGTKYILVFFIRDNEFTDELREKVRY